MSESNQLKRFDDYTPTVDCEECSHWWDDSCDGVSVMFVLLIILIILLEVKV